MLASITLLLLLSTLITATVIPRHHHDSTGDYDDDGDPPPTLNLPEGQTNLTVPTNQTVQFVGLGVGTQNYSCTNGLFSSIGAVATLYDIISIAATSDGDALPAKALAAQQSDPSTVSGIVADAVGADNDQATVLGQHYVRLLDCLMPQVALTAWPPSSSSPTVRWHWPLPTFDFRNDAESGDPDGVRVMRLALSHPFRVVELLMAGATQQLIIATKVAGLKDPTDSKTNVDWLQLINPDATTPVSSGTLAQSVYRLVTAGGQPPCSCNEGDTAFVPYAAQYWFLQ